MERLVPAFGSDFASRIEMHARMWRGGAGTITVFAQKFGKEPLMYETGTLHFWS